MARAIEFTLWLIDTKCSDKETATARMLKGYMKSHMELIKKIAKENFEGTKTYKVVMRFLEPTGTSAPNNGHQIKGIPIEIKDEEREKIDGIINNLLRYKYISGDYDNGFQLNKCIVSKNGLAWLFECGLHDRSIRDVDEGKLKPSGYTFPDGLDSLFGYKAGDLYHSLRQVRRPRNWEQYKDLARVD